MHAVDQHGRAFGRVARVAVRIAAGHHAHLDIAGRLVAAAVAHHFTGGDILDADNLAAQGHGGQQAERLRARAAGSAAGRAAVQHDAGPHPVAVEMVQQHAGRIAQAARQRRAYAGRARFKTQHLLGQRQARGRRFIGIGEMRHQGDRADVRHGAQTRIRTRHGARRKAQAVHARIHLQVHVDGVRQTRRCQHGDLFLAMHAAVQAILRHDRQIASVEKTFEQQDGLGPAQFAQAHGVIDLDQRQAIGVGKAPHGPFQAVAIGICLDDGPHVGAAGTGTGARQIVLHGIEMNGGDEGPGHKRDTRQVGKPYFTGWAASRRR
ncbi:hypothetical protein D3C87_934730 [compost metagenome]